MAEHNQAARAEIEHFGGREIHTTGDGFLVLLDSPARAVRCARCTLLRAYWEWRNQAKCSYRPRSATFSQDQVWRSKIGASMSSRASRAAEAWQRSYGKASKQPTLVRRGCTLRSADMLKPVRTAG